jgi:uncharacterized protein (TIGR00255 family)
MIQSMTGYGAAQHVERGVSCALEIRSVNNRYLKLSVKLPEYLQFLEPDVERLVRSRLSRGSVTCTLRVRSDDGTGPQPINVAVLQKYVDQMAKVRLPAGVEATIDLSTVATLPGVCEAPELDEEAQNHHLKMVTDLTKRGIDALVAMRQEEGEALQRDLSACCDAIRTALAEVAGRAPAVVEEYHERLRSRVDVLMQASELALEAEGLMREIAIYAERCDISEEVSRLNSHLDQFVQLCDRGNQVGRTLDFLTQEMLREANTVASKSNDTAIAQSVVQIKGLIDRLKEQVQNVE